MTRSTSRLGSSAVGALVALAALAVLVPLAASCSAFIPFSEYDKETATSNPTADGGSCAADLRTDSKNCGACGHDCRGRTCADALCMPEVVLARQNEQPKFATPKITTDATFVYVGFPNAQSIVRLQKTSFLTVTAVGTGLVGLEAIEAATNEDIYWKRADTAGHGIGRVPKNGGPGSFLELALEPSFVSSDGEALFYLDDSGTLFSVDKALAGTPRKIASPVRSYAVDGSFLYVITASSTAPSTAKTEKLRRLKKDGSEPLTLVEELPKQTFLSLDDEYIYWGSLDPPKSSVSRIKKEGGATQVLNEGGSDFQSILTVRGDFVYGFTLTDPNREEGAFEAYLWRLPKAGGSIVRLIATQRMTDLGFDADYLYWSTDDSVYRVAN